MIRIFSFCLILLASCLFSCSINKLSINQIPAQNNFQYTQTGDSTYAISVNYYDTVSYYESQYQDYMLDNSNKPEGKFIVKDSKGRIRRTLSYKNHKREGLDTWYDAKGQISQEKLFVNDRLVSYKLFYPNIRMLDTELTDTMGYKRHWDEEGHLIYEKNFRTGEFKEWYPNGKLETKGQECPGESFCLIGPWSYYTNEEKLDQIIFYHGSADANDWDSIYHYQGNQISSVERK